jgi:hypothetical protein
MARLPNSRDLVELLAAPTSEVSRELVPLLTEGASLHDLRQPDALPLTLSALETHATSVGYLLVEIDRELRRSVDLLTSSQAREAIERGDLPRAHGPSTLAVRSAEPGSLHFLLEIYDAARLILLNDPVQLASTLTWLYQFRPKRWGQRTPSVQPTSNQIVLAVEQSATAAINSGQPCEFHVELNESGSISAVFRTLGASRRNLGS